MKLPLDESYHFVLFDSKAVQLLILHDCRSKCGEGRSRGVREQKKRDVSRSVLAPGQARRDEKAGRPRSRRGEEARESRTFPGGGRRHVRRISQRKR